ncbi:hypothetical protein V1512DRAFT_116922 [Lipomyces arxii]|uniref:uncharacterized protein n=1 Tax=Lipomyces arxii TaxID=56418 RepID=UPI0034CDEA99
MIADTKLNRYTPSSFSAGLAWSSDGRLAIACTRITGGGITQSGVEIFRPDWLQSWDKKGMQGGSVATWIETVQRIRRWKDGVDGVLGTESTADGASDVAVTELAWSDVKNQKNGECCLGVLTSSLDVFLFESVEVDGKPMRMKASLSEIIGELENCRASEDDDDYGTAVTSKETLLRLRLHSIAWSPNCGQSEERFSFSIFATGNENGEVYLWRICESVLLLDQVKVCDGWITHVKFSPVISTVGEKILYLTVAASNNVLHLISIFVNGITIKTGPVSIVCPTARSAYDAIAWHPSNEIMLCAAARLDALVLVSISAADGAWVTSTHSISLFTPAMGIVFSSNTDSGQVIAVSALGSVVGASYGEKVDFDLSTKLTRIFDARAKSYLASRNENIRPAEVRVLGLTTDPYRNLAIMYSVVTARQLRYPILSEMSSRISSIELSSEDFWDTVQGGMSTRSVLVGAKFAARKSDQTEDEWLEMSIEALSRRAQNDQSGYWRRILTALEEWSCVLSPSSEHKSRVLENWRTIKADIAVQILTKFLEVCTSEVDSRGGIVVYEYARYLTTIVLESGRTETNSLVARVLSRLHNFGYEMADEMATVLSMERELMQDVGIVGMVSYDEKQVSASSGGEKHEKCVACGSDLELRFLPDGFESVCSNGHKWACCELTMLPLMSLHQRRCSICKRIFVSTDSEEGFIGVILAMYYMCVYCGGTLYVM